MRPTREEHDQRIELCCRLIGAGLYDSQIKKMVAKQFDLSPRSVEKYLRRARGILLDRRNRDRATHQAESMAFYEAIMQKPGVKDRDKLFARRRVDKLLGLEEPQRHQISGTLGLHDDERARLDEIERDPEARAAMERLAEKLGPAYPSG